VRAREEAEALEHQQLAARAAFSDRTRGREELLPL